MKTPAITGCERIELSATDLESVVLPLLCESKAYKLTAYMIWVAGFEPATS